MSSSLHSMANRKSKLKGTKNTKIVFGFGKVLRKEKMLIKENTFIMFSCLLKKFRLCLVIEKY